MSLSKLIRGKSERAGFATATPATTATQQGEMGRTVASVATVTVAKSPQGQTAHRFWLIHYADRDPAEVCWTPDITHAEILECNPDAIAAEPFTPNIRQPSAPMTADEEQAIRAWLARIGESDPESTAEVLRQCQEDSDARSWYKAQISAENLFPTGLGSV